jgi:hypothetical protein
MRLCIDRLVAPVKAQDAPAPVERLNGSYLADQVRAVMAGAADGTVTPDQGATLLRAGVAAVAQNLSIWQFP